VSELDIELIKVDNNNKETFENIYEFYLYEISKYLGYDVEENGKFSDNNTRNYIYNIKREQILIKKNGKYAGFLLIFKRDNYNYINEFGILPKYRSGFFTYKVIRKYFLETNKVTKFNIINENKRWLECVEYMINKNNDICKIIEKKEITFHKSKDQKYKFTSFFVEPV
jgi:hypothetical protein